VHEDRLRVALGRRAKDEHPPGCRSRPRPAGSVSRVPTRGIGKAGRVRHDASGRRGGHGGRAAGDSGATHQVDRSAPRGAQLDTTRRPRSSQGRLDRADRGQPSRGGSPRTGRRLARATRPGVTPVTREGGRGSVVVGASLWGRWVGRPAAAFGGSSPSSPRTTTGGLRQTVDASPLTWAVTAHAPYDDRDCDQPNGNQRAYRHPHRRR
jgi:hypothetical protein